MRARPLSPRPRRLSSATSGARRRRDRGSPPGPSIRQSARSEPSGSKPVPRPRHQPHDRGCLRRPVCGQRASQERADLRCEMGPLGRYPDAVHAPILLQLIAHNLPLHRIDLCVRLPLRICARGGKSAAERRWRQPRRVSRAFERQCPSPGERHHRHRRIGAAHYPSPEASAPASPLNSGLLPSGSGAARSS